MSGTRRTSRIAVNQPLGCVALGMTREEAHAAKETATVRMVVKWYMLLLEGGLRECREVKKGMGYKGKRGRLTEGKLILRYEKKTERKSKTRGRTGETVRGERNKEQFLKKA